jgi:ssDNA-binding Zn-finger/Zn-ribbon topoisomerase 1
VGVLRGVYADARRVRTCPDCGRAMAVRRGPRGDFLGCVGFPDCRRTAEI